MLNTTLLPSSRDVVELCPLALNQESAPARKPSSEIRCTRQGLLNVTGLICLLRDQQLQARQKSHKHSAAIITIVTARAYERHLADAFFAIENNRYTAVDADFRSGIQCSAWLDGRKARATIGGLYLQPLSQSDSLSKRSPQWNVGALNEVRNSSWTIKRASKADGRTNTAQ